ncbi:Ig-like domain-containing protein [Aeromonas veronii]|uniref:Ig-like domain-containing protein n=1 Tax=Aeromonas veronii TaxID=654 RepID=UPI002A6A03B2|nr:Ig-like domain-containing protein [Aeromonas veronii]
MITNAVTLEQGVTVTQLKGQIYLVAADGSRKLLAEGDVLPKGAVIVSPDGASFMGGGQSFNVQPASEQSEPAEEGDAPQLAQNDAAGTPDDINALQQAILGGADPTQAFEASAAGGAPAAGGGGIGGVAGASGNGGFVTIDRTGSATIAQAGFDTDNPADTAPIGDALGGEDEILFDGVPPSITVNAPDNTNDTTPTITGTTDAPAGSTVTLVVTDANGNQQTLTTTVQPDGSYSVDVTTPLAEGSYTVTATVTDPAGNTGTATDDGSVDIDDPVDAVDDEYTVNEDGSVSLNLLANDKAPDGGLKIVSINGIALTGGAQSIPVKNGVVEIAADGSMTFKPDENFNGDISFDYVAQDADGDTDSAKVNITVTPVNDAPTIDVVANDFVENSAKAGDVAATYTVSDEEDEAADLEVSFTGTSNAEGYYALKDGQVVLTDKGAAHVNAGNSLPKVELTVTDKGGLTGTGSDTPEVELVNDAPTIDVVANDFVENSAKAGDVAATYTVSDEEDEAADLEVSFTGTSNAEGYYALKDGQVVLTDKGAAHVNAGNSLPKVELTVTDKGGLTGTGSDTPEVELVNDAPTIDVVANDFIENSAKAGDVAATYTVSDEEDEAADLEVSFTGTSNAEGYYALKDGQVVLTDKGAAHVNAGNSLPKVELTVTDKGGLIGTGSDTPEVELVNDAPTIDVVANDFIENSAKAGDVAATYTVSDEEDEAADLEVSFTGTSNAEGYYALKDGQVVLTDKGAAHVNAGNSLPKVELTVTDKGGLTGTGSDTPEVELVNDAPTIDVVANDFIENSAKAGDVAATYTVSDEEDEAADLEVSFTGTSNAEGYYALKDGQVVLTDKGAAHVNAGNSLPKVELTVTDKGGLTGTGSDTPEVELVNDAPTIDVVANDFVENSAKAGDVAATYTVSDEEDEAADLEVSFTGTSNAEGYYALKDGQVVLTDKGAAHVNAGNSLPKVELTVTDKGGLTGTGSDTPEVELVNDAPTIDVVANDFIENSAKAGDVAATYTVSDEEDEAADLEVSFTGTSNAEGYYALKDGQVVLTDKGAAHVNAGNSLPKVELTVTDKGGLTGTGSDTPEVELVNDAPTIDVVANDFIENSAKAGDVAATYTVSDEEDEAADLEVSFTGTSNAEGYYALKDGQVVLTDKGAAHVNAGNSLPKVELTVTDKGGLTGTGSDTPEVELVNDAPTIDVVANDFVENSAKAGDVAATYTVSDEEDEAADLEVSFTGTSNAEGYYALKDGQVVLTDKGAAHVNAGNSLPKVELTVTDKGGLTGTGSDTPEVELVNDAPTIDVVANDFVENSAKAGDVAATYTVSDEEDEAADLEVSFTGTSNAEGYYALKDGQVVLTDKGAAHVNAGNSLPKVELTVTDKGGLTGTGSDTPEVELVNDAPTIDVVANDFVENSAKAGDVAATYTVSDEEDEAADLEVSFTGTSNAEGYYALKDGQVVLTDKGAAHVNAGNSLPKVELTVTDKGGLTGTGSDTPEVELVNDAPTIDVVANDFIENSAKAGDVAATYTVSDEEDEAADLEVSFTGTSNAEGYYALKDGQVVLTDKGAAHVNAGNSLPKVELTVTDKGGLTGTGSDTPEVELVNDAPTIDVVANDFVENSAKAGDVAATYTVSDEEDEAADLEVSFTGTSNAEGYYALKDGQVVLTDKGAAHVNAGNSLPKVELTVTDKGGLTGTGSDTPEVELVNDAPTIDVVANDFIENSAKAGDVAATYTVSDEEDEAADLEVSFTGTSNAEGYYALKDGQVVLTDKGAAHVNAGNSLPKVELTVTDKGGLTGTGSDTPEVELVNDAPTIDVVANDFIENSAKAGDVAATYTVSDEEDEAADLEVSFTGTSNAEGYYALKDGQVVLTDKGAAHVNAGNSLPKVELTVTDKGGLTGTGSDTPEVELVNDAPTIDVVANDFVENSAKAGDVAATYTVSDEEDEAADLEVSFTGTSNAEGYYALKDGQVVLTDKGAAHVNAGNSLPKVELTVTDKGGLTGTGSDTPEVELVNDAPTIDVVANDFIENSAKAGDVAATYTVSDEEDEAADLEVSFTGTSNAEGYYALKDGQVVLTDKGAAHVNAGNSLPKVELTVTDKGGLTGTGSDTPEVELVNDAPTIDVVANDFIENSAKAGDVAATYTVSDEEDEAADLEVSFTGTSNAEGYYALKDGQVVLTDKGAAHVNAGNSLPKVELTVTDKGGLTGTGSDTPEVELVNDAPTIDVVANDFVENSAKAGDVAATYTVSDEEDEAADLEVSFTGTSNAEGYYALKDGQVVLTDKGAAHVNAGNSLPKVELTVTDKGGLTGTGSDTPEVELVNDAPTIDVVANDFIENSAKAGDVAAKVELTVTDKGGLTGTGSDTPEVELVNDAPTIDVVANDFVENSAKAGDVAATYTVSDEEDEAADLEVSFTGTSNAEGYYALKDGQVVLTDKGAAHVNAGNSLPKVELTVTDKGGLTGTGSDTPEVELVNDAPTIDVVANDFVENSAKAGDVAATYTVSDEEDEAADLEVSFTGTSNAEGYYALKDGQVVLTDKGAAHVNAGNSLPKVELTVTDKGGLTGTGSDTPEVELVNDAPTIDVVANDFVENSAKAGDVAATYTVSDEEDEAADLEVSFTGTSNAEGYYALKDGQVVLTDKGAAHVNAGNSLPKVELTVTDKGGLTGTGSDTPEVELVNDAPTIDVVANDFIENSAKAGDVAATYTVSDEEDEAADLEVSFTGTSNAEGYYALKDGQVVLTDKGAAHVNAGNSLPKVELTVTDKGGLTGTGSDTPEVELVNDAPTIDVVANDFVENSAKAGDVAATYTVSDEEDEAADLEVSFTGTSNAEGYYALKDGQVVLTDKGAAHVNAGNSLPKVELTVTDKGGLTGTGSDTPEVELVNDAPTIDVVANDFVENSAKAGDVAATYTVSDEEDEAADLEVSFTGTSNAEGYYALKDGQVVLTDKGAAHVNAGNSLPKVELTVTDKGGLTGTGSDTPEVELVNDAPTIDVVANDFIENSAKAGDVAATYTVSDEEDEAADLEVSFTGTSNAEGYYALKDGQVVLTDKGAAHVNAGNSLPKVELTVTDKGGLTGTGSDTPEVELVNDAPTIDVVANDFVENSAKAGDVAATYTVSDEEDEAADLEVSFTGTSNAEGYYALKDGQVVLTDKGAAHVNAGNSLPKVELTVTDKGGLTGTGSDTPEVELVNDAPTIDVVANDFVENSAKAGDVAATYTVSDEEDEAADLEVSFTGTSNAEGYYALKDGQVVLTDKGAAHVNAGNSLPKVELTVTDKGGLTGTGSDTPEVELVNDAPTIDVVANDFIENSAKAGDVAATYTVSDEEDEAADLEVSFTGTSNAEGYYALKDGQVVLTDKGAAHVNAGNSLPKVELTVTDKGGLTGTGSDTPEVELVNDAPTIDVVANDFVENSAKAGDVAATYTVSDEEDEAADLEVSFTGTSNAEGYYALKDGQVVLTDKGAAHVNAGNSLPKVELTVTDKGGLTGTGSDTPEVELVNDAPTIDVVANDFVENSAKAGDVAATYTVSDEEDEAADLEVSFTGTSNAEGYYALKDGQVVLTDKGAAHVNAGNSLPKVELTVTDKGGLTGTGSDTPEVELVNDAPTIDVVANDFVENSAKAGDVAATYTVSDEEDEAADLEVSFTGTSNAEGYYALKDGQVVLTDKGAAHVNAGNSLPKVELTVTDKGGLTGTGSDTPEVELVNDAPTIDVVANDFIENSAKAGDVAATYTVSDEEDEAADLEVSFTGTSNAEGYYALKDGQVVLTDKGAAHVNAGNSLPKVELTVTDKGGLIGTGSDTPEVELVNDAPTIDVVANDFIENSAKAGDVAATYTVSDEEDEAADLEVSFTGTSNAEGYYALKDGQVVLTDKGAAHVNAGNSLPKVELTVTDKGGLTGTGSDTPEVELVNDAPTIDVVANDFIENSAKAGDVAATYTVSDEEDEAADLEVSFTGTSNAEGYYALKDGQVVLTDKGAAHVNAGNSLPKVELTVTDKGGLTGTGSDTPEVELVNDAPTIDVVANDFIENSAKAGDVAATYTVSDEEDEAADLEVSFTGTSNAEGYYALKDGQVVLTDKGAAHVNAGNSLPKVELTVTDKGGLTGTGSDTPEVELVNDAPTIDVVANDFVENSAKAGDVAATYTVSDEEDEAADLEVSFTGTSNAEGYYALKDGQVVLTDKGAAHVNAGNRQ